MHTFLLLTTNDTWGSRMKQEEQILSRLAYKTSKQLSLLFSRTLPWPWKRPRSLNVWNWYEGVSSIQVILNWTASEKHEHYGFCRRRKCLSYLTKVEYASYEKQSMIDSFHLKLNSLQEKADVKVFVIHDCTLDMRQLSPL